MTTIIHPDHAPVADLGEAAKSRALRKSRAAKRAGGLSDRTIAWLFVTPTILLLLAINIFPLIWTIRLSFTSLNLSMSYLPLRFVGLDNFRDILTDADIWARLQTTAHFVISSVALQVLLGFGLALLINRQFRSHSFWTTIILLPMMLSPAVVGNFWTFLFQPQIGLFNYLVSASSPACRRARSDDRRRQARALDHRHGRYLDVDALCHADLSRRASLDPGLHLRGGRGRSRLALAAILVDHAADGDAVPDARGAVPRHREFQDVRHGQSADLGRPGFDHRGGLDHAQARGVREMAHRLFSALAIILFVTVFGAANIYVKALNRVKQR